MPLTMRTLAWFAIFIGIANLVMQVIVAMVLK